MSICVFISLSVCLSVPWIRHTGRASTILWSGEASSSTSVSRSSSTRSSSTTPTLARRSTWWARPTSGSPSSSPSPSSSFRSSLPGSTRLTRSRRSRKRFAWSRGSLSPSPSRATWSYDGRRRRVEVSDRCDRATRSLIRKVSGNWSRPVRSCRWSDGVYRPPAPLSLAFRSEIARARRNSRLPRPLLSRPRSRCWRRTRAQIPDLRRARHGSRLRGFGSSDRVVVVDRRRRRRGNRGTGNRFWSVIWQSVMLGEKRLRYFKFWEESTVLSRFLSAKESQCIWSSSTPHVSHGRAIGAWHGNGMPGFGNSGPYSQLDLNLGLCREAQRLKPLSQTFCKRTLVIESCGEELAKTLES